MTVAVNAHGVALEAQAHGESYLETLLADYTSGGSFVRKRHVAALLLRQYPRLFTPQDLERILGRDRETVRAHARRARRELRRLGRRRAG